MKKIFYAVLISSLASLSYGQVHTFHVHPHQTDSTYIMAQDSHAVRINTSGLSDKLVLFLGGTGSNTTQYSAWRTFAVNLGFDVINLSYFNSVATASLSTSSDSLAFNKYRAEICFGTPISDAVSVDSLNAIYTRTLKLLQYLSVHDSIHNWGQYLSSSNVINWDKIVVAGHSQGAGHAAYLAKHFPVHRVLMFSGPNDYSDYFSRSANWLRTPGTTALAKHFSYLSLYDEAVAFTKQLENMVGLGMLQNDDTTQVDFNLAPYGNSHCLYTTQLPGLVLLYHNVPIKNTAINELVWEYMLTSALVTNIESPTRRTFIIYPNPVYSRLYIEPQTKTPNQYLYVINSLGQVLVQTKLSQTSTMTLDLSSFPMGVYYVKYGKESQKILLLR